MSAIEMLFTLPVKTKRKLISEYIASGRSLDLILTSEFEELFGEYTYTPKPKPLKKWLRLFRRDTAKSLKRWAMLMGLPMDKLYSCVDHIRLDCVYSPNVYYKPNRITLEYYLQEKFIPKIETVDYGIKPIDQCYYISYGQDKGKYYYCRHMIIELYDGKFAGNNRGEYRKVVGSNNILIHNEQTIPDGFIEHEGLIYRSTDLASGFIDADGNTGVLHKLDCIKSKRYGLFFKSADVANGLGFVYWDEEDDYVKITDIVEILEGDNTNKQNASYHSLERKDKRTKNRGFSIGFEVEKEDAVQIRKYYKPIYKDLGWCKENDGSLGVGGYELISPIYSLYDSTSINDALYKLEPLINATYTKRCGGHISIGHNEMNPRQIGEAITGYLPLLYAIYPERVDEGYCTAVDRNRYFTNNEKRRAIYIKDYVLEFRIFPAVKNVSQLKWRIRLIRAILKNPYRGEIDILKDILSRKSLLHCVLREIYSEEELLVRCQRYIDNAKHYNNVYIKKELKFTGSEKSKV